jgi:hypothetical protein
MKMALAFPERPSCNNRVKCQKLICSGRETETRERDFIFILLVSSSLARKTSYPSTITDRRSCQASAQMWRVMLLRPQSLTCRREGIKVTPLFASIGYSWAPLQNYTLTKFLTRDHEDGGNMSLRNVGTYVPNYTSYFLFYYRLIMFLFFLFVLLLFISFLIFFFVLYALVYFRAFSLPISPLPTSFSSVLKHFLARSYEKINRFICK